MKTEELLTLLKLTEQDNFATANQKYLLLLAEQEKQEKMRRIGAVNPFAPKPAVIVPVEELKNAWSLINTEIKYNHFKTTGTALEGSPAAKTKENEAPVKVSPALIHLTKDRATGPTRRAPTRKGSPLAVNDESQAPVDHVNATSNAQSVPVSTTASETVTGTTQANTQQTSVTSPTKKEPMPAVTKPQQNNVSSSPVQQTKQLTVADLQAAVADAVKKYIDYHTGGNKSNSLINRGQGDGFFSFLRHGAKGIATANALQKAVNSPEGILMKNGASLKDTALFIKDFLNNASRAYEHHSLTSYLGDALAQQGLVTAHNGKHYQQKEIVKNMEQWINTNCDSDPLHIDSPR